MTINELGKTSHENARNKGFYEEIDGLLNHPQLTDKQKKFIHVLWLSNRLMLITSELGEALEGIRHNNYSCEPKSGGFGEELADVQIRLAGLAASENLDLEAAIENKASFNRTRTYKHGERAV